MHDNYNLKDSILDKIAKRVPSSQTDMSYEDVSLPAKSHIKDIINLYKSKNPGVSFFLSRFLNFNYSGKNAAISLIFLLEEMNKSESENTEFNEILISIKEYIKTLNNLKYQKEMLLAFCIAVLNSDINDHV